MAGKSARAAARLRGELNNSEQGDQGLQPAAESASSWSNMGRFLKRPSVAVAASVVFTWFAATAWLRALSLPDEGRYVGVAWEIVRSGNWLVPTLDTLPYFHKPPLFYWLTAGALATFGNHEWAARLPSLLSATGAAVGLFAFLKRWTNEATALTALLALATMPFFFGGAQFANLDMLVAACITGTILCSADVVLAWKHDGRSRRLTLTGAYVLAALGVLAKGLVAIVIPAIVVGVWLAFTQQPRLILRLLWPPGLALFAIIVVPWFALMHARYPGFSDYFFLHHHVQRYLTRDFNGQQPFWFYGPVFAAVTLPWCAFLPWAVRNTDEGKVARDLHLLLWIWLAVTLVFFSIPSSKLLGYVLPASPALAALAALAIMRQAGTRLGSRFNVIANAAVAASVCLALVLGYAIHYRRGIGQVATRIRPEIRPGDRLLAINHYPFSLSFYLRATQPIIVVDDWNEVSVLRKDNWRKELFEAAKFEPARGSRLLLGPSELEPTLCTGRTWVFGVERELAQFPHLQLAREVARSDTYVVRLSDSIGPGC